MKLYILINRGYETERRSWPSNGLRFAEAVLDALSFDCDGDALRLSRAQQMLNQQRSDPTSELHRLIGLIASLKVCATNAWFNKLPVPRPMTMSIAHEVLSHASLQVSLG